MNIRRFIILTVLAVAPVFVACKDKDKEEDPVYLVGTLVLDNKFPAYVTGGETFTFIPSAVTRKEDDKSTACTGYYFYSSLNTAKKDTTRFEGDDPSKNGAWTYTIPSNHLGELAIYCNAFAKGYSNKAISSKTTVVNPSFTKNGSITGLETIVKNSPKVSDEYGNEYCYKTVAGMDWTIQNLANPASGCAYDNSELMARIFGRFYTWEEAMAACPQGWRLPSSADWDVLEAQYGAAGLMADVCYQGSKMWTYWPEVQIDNASGMSVIPAGYAMAGDTGYNFVGLNNYAMFWTSDESTDDPDFAIARYIYEDNNRLLAGAFDKNGIAASVRCIRE